ncbi:MAG: PAS domain S-box protein [Chloroflexi bacterium]|nr:MAG: PAS domain S-box protein [Chloroflexota bacterium]
MIDHLSNSSPGRHLDFVHALNAAAAQLQKAAHSEEEVFTTFQAEMVKLGIRGSIYLRDAGTDRMVIRAIAMPGDLLPRLEGLTGIPGLGYSFPLRQVEVFCRVLDTAGPAFVADNRAVIAQILPEAATAVQDKFWPLLGTFPAVYAPLQVEAEVCGILSVTDSRLTPADVPAVLAFANHLSAAIENARLFTSLQEEIRVRRQVEQSLRESEARYRALVENIPAITYIAALDETSTTLYVSPQVEQVLGFKPEEYTKEYDVWFHQLHPDDRDRVLQEVAASHASGKPFRSEYRMLTRDGRTIWIRDEAVLVRDSSGQAMFLQGVMFDITDQKVRDEELQHLVQFRETIIDDANVWIDVLDADGNVILWNKAAEQISGYSREEVVGHARIWEWLYPDTAYRQKIFATAMDIIQRGEVVENFETTILCKDGTRRVISWHSRNLENDTGQPIGSIAIGRDVTPQKEAELALQKNLNRLTQAQQIARLGHWEYDPQTDTVVRADIIYRLFGTTPETMPPRGGTFYPLIHPEDRGYVEDTMAETLRAGGSYDIVYRIIRPDGQERVMRDRARLETDPQTGTRRLVGISQDITEWRYLQRRLYASEHRFRTLFEKSPDAIFVLEPLRGDPVIEEVNQAACRMTGYRREELVGMPFSLLSAGDTQQERLARFHQLHEAGALTFETRQRRKDGSLFPVEVRASLIEIGGERFILFIERDITERQKMRSLEKRLSAVVEQSGDIIMMTNPQGVIMYVNPAFEQATGYCADEVIGKTPRILKSGQQNDDFYRDLWQTITAGKVWRGQFVNRKKDGSLYTEQATISPIVDDAGKIASFVAIKRDITREMELEKRYLQAQKMEAVGRLTAGIAHDFNNLLTSINGFAQLLQSQLPPDDSRQELVTRISRAGERAAGLVQQLLAFSRSKEMSPREVDLNHLVREVAKMLRPIIGEHIQLQTRLSPNLLPVKADSTRLHQVILNLAVNARDAMPNGGELLIATENVPPNGSTEPPRVRLTVRDTGVGMSREVMEHIFEPFYTTKPTGQGTGLGLATVYGIVTQSGGEIDVESEEGRGTTFTIYLPAVEPVPEKAGSSPLPANQPPRGSETVLLVEDDEGVRALLQVALEVYGYHLLIAGSGEEARRVAAAHSGPIHLLVTDVVLPDTGGKQLAETLLLDRPEMRVLLMSGYPDQELARHGILQTEVPFVQKPIVPAEFLRLIRRILDNQQEPAR